MCNVCQACKLPLIIAMFFCMTNIHILFRKLSSKILHFESNTFKKCHWTHLFELPEVTWAAACLFVVDNTKNLKLDLSHGRRQMLCSNSHHPHTDPHSFIIETALPLTWPTANSILTKSLHVHSVSSYLVLLPPIHCSSHYYSVLCLFLISAISHLFLWIFPHWIITMEPF